MIRGAHTTVTVWQPQPLPVSAMYVSKTSLTENTSSGFLPSSKKTGKDPSVDRDGPSYLQMQDGGRRKRAL